MLGYKHIRDTLTNHRFSPIGNSSANSWLKVFAEYIFFGGLALFLRLRWPQRYVKACATREKFKFEEFEISKLTTGRLQRILGVPFVPLLLFLLCTTLFLPASPWRHLTSTLGYDVVHALSSVMLSKLFSGSRGCSAAAVGGSNPLGNLKYNPADDPYYVSNLEQPIDDFIR